MKLYNSKIFHSIPAVILVLSLFSCNAEPEPINYNKDECEHCRMLISDDRYGAELITDKGKVYKFDSIECLINFALAKNVVGDEMYILLVTDFAKPERLIETKSSLYIHNDNFRSPMGLNVSAFGNKSEAQKFLTENGGKKITWFDVIELVRQHSM